MAQTYFDVRHSAGSLTGLYCNGSPLRRAEAECLAEQQRANGHAVAVLPTRDELWERTYGDDLVDLSECDETGPDNEVSA